jgi:hypothetical protein
MFVRRRARRVREADNLASICGQIVNVGSSTCHFPIHLYGLLLQWLYFLYSWVLYTPCCFARAVSTLTVVVFWDIKTQFVPHRRHITSPLQSPAN